MLAWRLLHEQALANPPAWLKPLLPVAPALDRDPIAQVLASAAVLLALLYLGAALRGASHRLRLGLVGAGAAVLVAVPTLAFVALGAATDRPYGQDGGVVQLPLALEKLLQGESPYGADYSGTILARQARASAFWEPLGGNPILRHHAYLPGTHLLMLPGYLASRALLGFFDPRLVTLLFYAAAIVFAWRLPEADDARLAAAGLAAFNPLTWWQQVFGANDVVFVALLLGAVLLARRRRALLGAALLGLACATKQLAWPFAPFLLVSLAFAVPPEAEAPRSLRGLLSGPALRRLAAPTLVAILVFVAVVAPVAALAPRAFYGDIVQYNVGLPGDNYPLGGTPGFGFANFLIAYGRVTSLGDYFPFGRFYLLFLPLGLLLLHRQLRAAAGRPEAALVMGSAALFASIYFSRVVHPNYLVPVALLLPVGLLALRWSADLALVPLALGALAVTVSEQEVFRSVWDGAVAARVPEVLPALVRAALPHPSSGLTHDPIGLVVSAAAAGLGLVVLVAGLLGASVRVRAGLGFLSVVAMVVVPAWLVVTVGSRTGTPRGLDGWVAQVPADAQRLKELRSPYAPPASERPVAKDAWSASFRQNPPAERKPDRPLVLPGATWLGLLARAFGGSDPRLIGVVALALVLALAARGAPALAPGLALLLPAAFGLVFGASGWLSAGGLAAVALLRQSDRSRAAAAVFGASVALDFRALVGAALLAPRSGEETRPRLVLALAAGAMIALPVWLLDPGAFLGVLVRLDPTPAFGVANLLVYGGATTLTTLWLLKGATLLTAGLGAWCLHRESRTDPWLASALLSLALLWLDPSPPAGALALPVLLLGLGASGTRRPG